MKCEPTKTPGSVDIVALRGKYRQERDKRLNSDGERQYVRVAGRFHDIYTTDRHKPVEPRDPISEDIDVVILGAGFGSPHDRRPPAFRASVPSALIDI